MKGKYANRTENRQAAAAEAEVARLRAELKTTRDEAAAVAKGLRTENAALTAEMVGRAGALASAEVERQIAAFHEERERRGLADTIAEGLTYKMDRLIMNACRYISMTKGYKPPEALKIVAAWATDKDIYGLANSTQLLIELGVPRDGFASMLIKQLRQTRLRVNDRMARRNGTPAAVALDKAEQDPERFNIHPSYKPDWYPRIRYGEAELTDDEAQP